MRSLMRTCSLLVASLLFIAALVHPVLGQKAPGRQGTFAITDARIVPVTGAVIESGTLVVRADTIAALGADVQAPSDAEIIDGSGLTVYPD